MLVPAPDHRELLRTAVERLGEAIAELRTEHPTVQAMQSVSAVLVRLRADLTAAEELTDWRANRDADLVYRIALAVAHGATAWGPWSDEEQLFVALALDNSELLRSLGYSRSEALERWRLEAGLDDLAAVEDWITVLRECAAADPYDPQPANGSELSAEVRDE